MALRDQPYLPLYIQDFMTDEKLAECSASTTGVYIRLMCLMHKSDHYGVILLKQKYKQNTDQIKNFSSQICKQMPYDFHTVTKSLEELIHEKVISIEGDKLIQKRMVKDNDISEKRALSGKLGGESTAKNIDKNKTKFAKAKKSAKYEYENEDVNENEIVDEDKKGIGGLGGRGGIVIYSPAAFLEETENSKWLENIAAHFGSEIESCRDRLRVFTSEQNVKSAFPRNLSDITNHFFNWYRMQIKNSDNNKSSVPNEDKSLSEKIKSKYANRH